MTGRDEEQPENLAHDAASEGQTDEDGESGAPGEDRTTETEGSQRSAGPGTPGTAGGPPSEHEAPAETGGGGDLEGELALLTLAAERDDYVDALRRLQADFDNFRKRSIRQQTEVLERASERLVVDLLPVLDALDLATAHVVEDSSDASKALAQIGALLRDILAREGLERIDSVGVAFDPTVHDAVGRIPAPEAEQPAEGADAPPPDAAPGDVAGSRASVVDVMRSGYRLKSKVLRPAMVTVQG